MSSVNGGDMVWVGKWFVWCLGGMVDVFIMVVDLGFVVLVFILKFCVLFFKFFLFLLGVLGLDVDLIIYCS